MFLITRYSNGLFAMDGRPIKRKYARVERERRFLVRTLPPKVNQAHFHRIDDLYIAGTQCRLRKIQRPDGREEIAKLGQKLPCDRHPDCNRHRLMTTLYMTFDEAAVFDVLPGKRLTKRRYYLQEQDCTFAIDVIESPEHSPPIILCEVECEDEQQLSGIHLPEWAVCEITDDSHYSGFSLAR